MQISSVNTYHNNVSFGGVVFKNKAIFAKYGNGIVGSIRNNNVVKFFGKNDTFDIVFTAVQDKDFASFYWILKKKNGGKAFFQNLLAPKVFFTNTKYSSKTTSENITFSAVNSYIKKYFG